MTRDKLLPSSRAVSQVAHATAIIPGNEPGGQSVRPGHARHLGRHLGDT